MLQRVAILGVTYYLQFTGAASAECRDLNGRRIAQGIHYVPGPDACTLCVCDSGNPKWCKAVLCSPPQNCKSFRVGNTCCEFICLDDTLSKSDGVLDLDGNTDIGLRLVASAVTAVLSLSLLFFLIHRLRQRKIRGRQNRQLSEDERSLGSIGYIAGSIGYLQGSMGYLGNGSNDLEFHYEEPPSHYPLWKPPGNYFPRGEAPPPYEEAVAAARAEASLIVNSTTNSSAQYPNTTTCSVVQSSCPTTTMVQTVQTCSVTPVTAIIRTSSNNNVAVTNRSDVSTNTTSRGAENVRIVNNIRTAELSNNETTSLAPNQQPKVQTNEQPKITTVIRTSESSSNRQPRYERSASSSSSNMISHTNSHRTIPKNLTTNPSLCAATEPLLSSISRRDNHTEITPSIEFKSLPKRSSKEKVCELTKTSTRPDIYYEDITPQQNPRDIMYTGNSDIYVNRHRTIPRHLSSTGLGSGNNNTNSNNSSCNKTHSTYNISISNKDNKPNVPVTTRPNSIHYPATSVISLPTSPVPPPGVFGNNTTPSVPSPSDTKEKIKNTTLVSTPKSTSTNAINTSSSQQQVQKEPSQEVESSLDGSYQCLHQNFDDEDYRSECENCKSAHGSRYYLAEDDEDELSSPNETMTLQRRPIESQTDTLGHGPTYYRTSLTLPTNTKKLRSTSMHGTPSNHGAREAWFSSMPESTSSEED